MVSVQNLELVLKDAPPSAIRRFIHFKLWSMQLIKAILLSKLCFPAYFWTIRKERNHRIIRSTSRPWEVVPSDVFKQIKTRESFLNLVTSSESAAEWDLPPYPRMNFSPVYIKSPHDIWKFFLYSQNGFLVGIPVSSEIKNKKKLFGPKQSTRLILSQVLLF